MADPGKRPGGGGGGGGEGISGSGRPSLPLPEGLVDPSLQQLSHIELFAFCGSCIAVLGRN